MAAQSNKPKVWFRASVLTLVLAIIYACWSEEWRWEKMNMVLYMPVLFLNKICLFWSLLSVDYDGSGVRYPRATLRRWLFDDIAAWEPNEDDLIISAFSDPSLHLVGQICAQIAGNGKLDFDRFSHAAAFLDVVSSSTADDDRDLTLANYRERAPTTPRVVVTHMPSAHLKTGSSARFVAVIRDPFESLVSLHNEMGECIGESLAPLEEEVLCDMFVRIYGGWAEHALRWWRLRDQPNVLVLFHEDLVRDARPGIKAILRLLGRKDDDAALVEAVKKRSSPDQMAALAAKFARPRWAADVPLAHFLLGPRKPFNATRNPDPWSLFNNMQYTTPKASKNEAGLHHETVNALRRYALRTLYKTDFPFSKYIRGPYFHDIDE